MYRQGRDRRTDEAVHELARRNGGGVARGGGKKQEGQTERQRERQREKVSLRLYMWAKNDTLAKVTSCEVSPSADDCTGCSFAVVTPGGGSRARADTNVAPDPLPRGSLCATAKIDHPVPFRKSRTSASVDPLAQPQRDATGSKVEFFSVHS